MKNLFKKAMHILSEEFSQYEQLSANTENECHVVNSGAFNLQFLAKVKKSDADNTSVENGEKKGTGLRLQNGIILKKSNLDCRAKHRDRRAYTDRRSYTDSNYKGPSRRYTIDRRLNLKDRRDMD